MSGLPPLPHALQQGVNLLQLVGHLASQIQDPEQQHIQDFRVLIVLGIGEWVRTESQLCVVRMTDPAQILVSVQYPLPY